MTFSKSLESLKYPMFETTEQEKELLREAKKFIGTRNLEYFLCIILNYVTSGEYQKCDALIQKIRERLGGLDNLTYYLNCSHLNCDDRAELRRIWIDKLLEYKGE